MAPDLMGAAEIAEYLGVSRQRVDQLTRQEGFPEPVQELVSGRIWKRQAVEKWAKATGRKVKR